MLNGLRTWWDGGQERNGPPQKGIKAATERIDATWRTIAILNVVGPDIRDRKGIR